MNEFFQAKYYCPLLITLQVFSAARTQGQQSLVLEWILIILANFIRMPSDEALVATWNHLCFFTAASCNQWLRSVYEKR